MKKFVALLIGIMFTLVGLSVYAEEDINYGVLQSYKITKTGTVQVVKKPVYADPVDNMFGGILRPSSGARSRVTGIEKTTQRAVMVRIKTKCANLEPNVIYTYDKEMIQVKDQWGKWVIAFETMLGNVYGKEGVEESTHYFCNGRQNAPERTPYISKSK